MPNEPAYFASDLRFDNVLIGDYQQVIGNERFAQGGPMVHIRAIPEGGTPQSRAGDPRFKVNAPRTFYGITSDARQPLPSLFAARWISGGPAGFETFYKIWREPRGTVDSCSAGTLNRRRAIEAIRFDESENMESLLGPPIPGFGISFLELITTSKLDVERYDSFPPNTMDGIGGWMYLNLEDLERTFFEQEDPVATQGWVVVSMRAEGRFSVDFDAAALGNGCSAARAASEVTNGRGRGLPIGPAPNIRE